jgi:uncharacterized membrane protein
MIHPIFSLLISRPHLVMDHVAAYAALVQEEASSAGADVAKRAIAWAAAAVAFLIFLILAGVAVMLGAVQDEFHWTLVAVPAVPLIVSIIAFIVGRQHVPAKAFAELKAQLDADAHALRAIGAQS